MRWKPKPNPATAPEIAKREVMRFALWPTLVEGIDGYDEMVWLEFYTAYQEYRYDGYGWYSWRTLTRFARYRPQEPDTK